MRILVIIKLWIATSLKLSIVMLSVAKHLTASLPSERERPFAALRVTWKGNLGAMRHQRK